MVSLSPAPLARPLVSVPLATVTPVLKSMLPEALALAPAEALAAGLEASAVLSPDACLFACPLLAC